MLKSYEATYEKGSLKWLYGEPPLEDGERVIVVVEVSEPSKRRKEEIRSVLDRTRGAWGTGKTLDQIDRKIEAARTADWQRDWTAKK